MSLNEIQNKVPLVSLIVQFVLCLILILVNDSSSSSSSSSRPISSSEPGFLFESTDKIYLVPYKKYYGIPSECNHSENEVRNSTSVDNLDEFHHCQIDSASRWNLNIWNMLTVSKEFCCFLRDVLQCETNVLHDCDQRYSELNFHETTRMIKVCGRKQTDQCHYSEEERQHLEKISNMVKISLGIFLSVLGVFGAIVYLPTRKFLLSSFHFARDTFNQNFLGKFISRNNPRMNLSPHSSFHADGALMESKILRSWTKDVLGPGDERRFFSSTSD